MRQAPTFYKRPQGEHASLVNARSRPAHPPVQARLTCNGFFFVQDFNRGKGLPFEHRKARTATSTNMRD